MSETFNGFEKPQANFVKVPTGFWDITDLTLHQKMVLLYILRHTWGYQEFGIYKSITVDEFQRGRKRGDSSRMDAGVGISRGSVHNCLKALEEKGYIEVDTDATDAARVKKSYRLNMAKDSVQEMNTAFTPRTQRSPDEHKRSPDERDQRKTLKKDTKRKILKEKEQQPGTPGGPGKNPTPILQERDTPIGRCCRHWEKNHSPLVSRIKDNIVEAVAEFGEISVLDAMNEAVEQNIRGKWSYVAGILRNWKKEGRRPKSQDAELGLKKNADTSLTEGELIALRKNQSRFLTPEQIVRADALIAIADKEPPPEEKPAPTTPEGFWDAACAKLANQLDRAHFDTWLRPCVFQRVENGVYLIGVTNRYALEWCEGVTLLIATALSEVVGHSTQVRYEIYRPGRATDRLNRQPEPTTEPIAS